MKHSTATSPKVIMMMQRTDLKQEVIRITNLITELITKMIRAVVLTIMIKEVRDQDLQEIWTDLILEVIEEVIEDQEAGTTMIDEEKMSVMQILKLSLRYTFQE